MHFINFNVAIATAPSRPIGEKTDAGDYQIYAVLTGHAGHLREMLDMSDRGIPAHYAQRHALNPDRCRNALARLGPLDSLFNYPMRQLELSKRR